MRIGDLLPHIPRGRRREAGEQADQRDADRHRHDVERQMEDPRLHRRARAADGGDKRVGAGADLGAQHNFGDAILIC